MKTTRRIIACTLLAGLTSLPASAATLTTAPISGGTLPIQCLVLNAGAKPRAILIEQFGLVGQLINDNRDGFTGAAPIFQPGEASALNGDLSSPVFYCRFTFKGGARNVRGAACVAGGSGCVPATSR